MAVIVAELYWVHIDQQNWFAPDGGSMDRQTRARLTLIVDLPTPFMIDQRYNCHRLLTNSIRSFAPLHLH